MLEIIHQDQDIIAINKPHGLLVHRSKMANDAKVFAMQMLRDQIGQKVYPAHRLDRKTSGVLLFGLSTESNTHLQKQFQEKQVEKSYLAIVRGYTDDAGTIDYPLRRDDGKLQEAVTHYKTISRSEISVAFGAHPTSRYSLVEAKPETGRMHQLRKHLAHIFHPIIADRAHGCNKQNRLFKEKWEMDTMLLHASSVIFNHPTNEQKVQITAELQPEFLRIGKILDLKFP
jgi:tRNA pseudouridine65 synthase